MLDPDLRFVVAKFVRVLQIVVFGIAGGALVFLAVAFFLTYPPDEPAKPSIVTYFMLLMGFSMVAARIVVPGWIVAKQRRRMLDGATSPFPLPGPLANHGEAGRLLALYQVRTIVAAALLEGGALGLIVAFLLEGALLAAGMSLILIAGILAGFPTTSAAESWISDQLRLLREERALR